MKSDKFKYKVKKLIDSEDNSPIEWERSTSCMSSVSMRTVPLLKTDLHYCVLCNSVHCFHDVLKYLFQDK